MKRNTNYVNSQKNKIKLEIYLFSVCIYKVKVRETIRKSNLGGKDGVITRVSGMKGQKKVPNFN